MFCAKWCNSSYLLMFPTLGDRCFFYADSLGFYCDRRLRYFFETGVVPSHLSRHVSIYGIFTSVFLFVNTRSKFFHHDLKDPLWQLLASKPEPRGKGKERKFECRCMEV